MNKVILIGNLGKDPEIKQLNSGSVANFSMATTHRWKDKNTGEKMEKTEWHNVSMFGGLAKIAASYLTKGSKVCIEGRLQTRHYDRDGVKVYVTEIVAENMELLGEKKASTSTAVHDWNNGDDVAF